MINIAFPQNISSYERMAARGASFIHSRGKWKKLTTPFAPERCEDAGRHQIIAATKSRGARQKSIPAPAEADCDS